MTISSDARTPSATVHPLSGSTPPGAGAVMQPFGVATAPAVVHELPDSWQHVGTVATDTVVAGLAARRAAPHPDAAVIDLAGRVAPLAARTLVLWTRVSKIEDAAQIEVPPLTAASMDGLSIKEAVRRHDRDEAAAAARMGLPRWEKLAVRASRRLDRWGLRLAHLAPLTQSALKAKVEASQACLKGEGSSVSGWRKDLAASIGADALRIIGAEADARAEADRLLDGGLLALGRAWEASCARYERACAAEEASGNALDLFAPPEVLFNRPEETGKLGPCPTKHMPTGRYWYGDLQTINTLRRMAEGGHPHPRRDEILAAHDRWQSDIEAENERSGQTVAKVERQAAAAENAALRARISFTAAHTPAGIDLKLRVILWLHEDLGADNGLACLEEAMMPENFGDASFSDALALSVALDLARQSRASSVKAEPLASAA